jgi:glycerol-3-phosphate dehydrogenase
LPGSLQRSRKEWAISGNSRDRRQASFERLGRQPFDLLVIGAGIVGSRVAYEAASDGLTVALVDAGDFGGATSSASSKLLHGGLRYLSTGDLRLVRELHAERRVIATRIATHLTAPLPLVVVVEGRSRALTAKLDAALPLYAALSGFSRPLPRRLSVEAAQALIPPMRREAVTSCGIVTEAVTNDARLTLATVHAAARAGASTTNYVRVIELEREFGRAAAAVVEDVVTGERLRMTVRAMVNATGPWVDVVRTLEDPGSRPLVRLSKGVHAVVPLVGEWRAGLALFDDSATAIAIPWHGMLLLGATDTPHEASPTRLAVDPTDVRWLLDRFRNVLPREQLRADRVVHTFAGLRVLPRGEIATERARRRHVVAAGPAGMVTIAGGKLTTHRLIAMEALRHLPAEVRPRRRAPRDEPLGYPCSGATESILRTRLDSDTATHLIRLYGEEARRVAAYDDHVPDAFDRIDARGPDIWAQVDFARDEEWAVTVADVVARRTTLAIRGLASEPVVNAVPERLGKTDGVVSAPSIGADARAPGNASPLTTPR